MNFYLGEILMGGWNFAPRGSVECNGQLLAISQFTALFSLLGTNFGGDGRTTFGVPDLRGRVPIHEGQGPGLSNYRLGQKGGSENNFMTTLQMPAHHHGLTQARLSIPVSSDDADQDENEGNFLANGRFYHAVPDAEYGTGALALANSTDLIGNSAAINNMEPFNVITYVIVTEGIFPSRT
ncbi:MAG: tail fiber protein [Bacteroidota bacterium]